MGDNFDFEGFESILLLLQKRFSFAFIFGESAIEQIKVYPRGFRDFDLLKEKNGEK